MPRRAASIATIATIATIDFVTCRLICWLAFCFAADHIAQGQGHAPGDAVRQMTVAGGFEVRLVACEPLVRQPVCIEFDDRGRLWVIQYLQYPNPEGLQRVRVDRYSRTEYQRAPEPPPHGPRGADRITILEDSDGDGRMDRGHDFVNGLNLATGIAFGHGGVFVLNVPYLLFYPDRDRDDIPDGDPEVLLTGFGMQDAHSVANSLTWGPDGWLYGCQGSTVTAKIRGIEFQQGVWRYHPPTKKFELFCEGGGNSWGLDFDPVGKLMYSTNYGGYVLLHGVQGGYYVKSFSKHGALHNPHTFGYFDHAPHANFQGGHVTVGGLVYQGNSFPASLRGKYIAADLLGHGVYVHDIQRRGSTVQTLHHSVLLQAGDDWFAPTDLTMGRDGSIYVADWHDARTAHPDPDADWDRSNGRIYQIAAKGAAPAESIDFAVLATGELLELHAHPSQWYVRRARQELVRRQDPSALAPLRKQLSETKQESAILEELWSLHALGGFDEAAAFQALDSSHAAVRHWTVRFLGDAAEVSEKMAHRLDEMAEREPDVWVRQQLACTSARLPAHQAIPIVNANINRDVDNDDPFLPLLWWWAIERHSIEGREEVLKRFVRPSLWKSRLGSRFLLPRLVRRYAAEGTPMGFDSILRLLDAAPDQPSRDRFWEPILMGLQDSPNAIPEHRLADIVLSRWKSGPDDNNHVLRLAIAMGHREPTDAALDEAINPATPSPRRVTLLKALMLAGENLRSEPLLGVVRSDADDEVRTAALKILAQIDDPALIEPLIDAHQRTESEPLRYQLRDGLLGRRTSALAWLERVDRGEIAASVTPIDQVRRVGLFGDRQLDRLVLKHWGRLEGATREESLAEVRRLNNDLRAGPGDPVHGRKLFTQHCSACHQFFGEGKKVGPDLTTANRADRNALLIALVAPSSVIRREYVSLVIETTDGRVLTGLPIDRDSGDRSSVQEQNPTGITLIDNKGVANTISSGDIERIVESNVSLMPDDLYRQLTPQQLRDLFAYLQSPQAIR